MTTVSMPNSFTDGSFSMAFTTTEPTLPLHLQYAYGFNSVKVRIFSCAGKGFD
jgi:hypothetical protein